MYLNTTSLYTMYKMNYRISINHRNYESWTIYQNEQQETLDIHPLQCKLMNDDIFTLTSNNEVSIIHRNKHSIPAILVLCGNKTFGREKKDKDKDKNKDKDKTTDKITNPNKSLHNGRLLYKCIPDDVRLPCMLVPYEMKQIGYSKTFTNLYVMICYDNWRETHPCAKLDCVIGPVNVLDHFYEYQLYCKGLHTSIQRFHKDTIHSLQGKSSDSFLDAIKLKYPSIEDRTDPSRWNIMTIDPKHSTDFDDGVGMVFDTMTNTYMLSIYISNVTIWLDMLQLWDSFSMRISTMYLPDKKRPMLPTCLSDGLCSLQQHVRRVAFVMDVFIKDDVIIDTRTCNAMIQVSHNYVYEEPALVANTHYSLLLHQVQRLSTNYKYINYTITDSHDVVCYLMTFMNFHCAKNLHTHHTGIFRIIKERTHTVPEEVSRFIQQWNNGSGEYVAFSHQTAIRHELLDLDAYVHITSPIRRLVDVLNMIQFQTVTHMLNLSEHAAHFYDSWLNQLDYINTTMRSIRKLQSNCELLQLCSANVSILEKQFNGFVFDKVSNKDGVFQYCVYLPELKLSSRIHVMDDLPNYSSHQFRLFIFHDEERLKRKIRMQLVVG